MLDMHEAEGNLDKLAVELRDQDMDFIQVLDEHEEIETHYEELYAHYQKGEAIIESQREVIE